MGSSFIIPKSMLEKNGRQLMLEFCDSIYDKECLKEHSEIREQRKYWDENVEREYKRLVLKDKHIYKDKDNKLITFLTTSLGNIFLNPVTLDFKDEYKDLTKLEGKELVEYIKDKIHNSTIEIEFVFEFLNDMTKKLNLDSGIEFEINEDLLCLKKAFLMAYDLFHHCGHELK